MNLNTRRIFLCLGLALLIATPVTVHHLLHRADPSGDVDESAGVFFTYYYHLAFQRGQWTHPDWQDLEAYSHPPLGKWIFGAALSRQGLVETSPENKKWWHENGFDLYRWKDFLDEVQRRTNPKAILAIRDVSFCFGLLTLLSVYLLGAQISQAVGVIAAFLTSCNPLFQSASSLGMFDTQILFWITSALALQAWLARQFSNPFTWNRQIMLGSFSLGILFALGFLTKISAVMAWCSWFALCGLAFWIEKKPALRGRLIVLGIGVIFFALLLIVAINPTFWESPVGNIIKMYTVRLDLVELQRKFFFIFVFDNWLCKLVAEVRHLFFQESAFYTLCHVPADLFLFLFGMATAVRELWVGTRTEPPALSSARILTVITIVILAITTITYALDWQRYLLSVVPLIMIVVAQAAVRIAEPWQRNGIAAFQRYARQQATAWIVLAVLSGIAWVIAVGPFRVPVNYLSNSESQLRHHLNALEYHPRNKTLQATIAILSQKNGDNAFADALWTKVHAADPQEEIAPIHQEQLAFLEAAAKLDPGSKPLLEWLPQARARSVFLPYRHSFYLSGHPSILVGINYPNALQKTDEILHADMDDLKKNNCNLIVIQASDFQSDGSIESNRLPALKNICESAMQRGMIVGVTLSRSSFADSSAHQKALVRLTEILLPHRNVYFNLDGTTPEPVIPMADVRQFRDKIKSIDPWRSVTVSHSSGISSEDFLARHKDVPLDFITIRRPVQPPTVTQSSAERDLNQIIKTGKQSPLLYETVPVPFGPPDRVAPDLYLDLDVALNSGVAGWCLQINPADKSSLALNQQLTEAEIEFLKKLSQQ